MNKQYMVTQYIFELQKERVKFYMHLVIVYQIDNILL